MYDGWPIPDLNLRIKTSSSCNRVALVHSEQHFKQTKYLDLICRRPSMLYSDQLRGRHGICNR